MGFTLSCFRQSSSSSPQSLAAEKQKIKHDRSGCSGMSSFMMFGCLWTKQTKKEQQEQQLKMAPKQESTLEDWLISSPGEIFQRNNGASCFVGEYHVLKHSSKRIFPSFVKAGEMGTSSSKPRESFSKEKLLITDDNQREEADDMEVSLSRSQSGKSQKRVSFRLPEEADIFIFHSTTSEEDSTEDQKQILISN